LLQDLGFSKEDLLSLPETAVGTAKSGTQLTILGELAEALVCRFRACPGAPAFSIKPAVLDNLSMDINISGPFLKAQGIDQIHSEGALSYHGFCVPLRARIPATLNRVYALENATIAPGGLLEIPVKSARKEAMSVEPSAEADRQGLLL